MMNKYIKESIALYKFHRNNINNNNNNNNNNNEIRLRKKENYKNSSSNVYCISLFSLYITKTCLYNIDPHQPHFYIVKLGLRGVYIIFLISAQKHRLCVLVRTASARRF